MTAEGDQPNPLKLFLGGLSYDSTEDSIVAYFAEKFGADKVSEAQVVRDRLNNQSRGFGFVTFTDAEVARIVQTTEHTIDGRNVMARKATPKSETPHGPAAGGPGMGGGCGYGGGSNVGDVASLPDYNPLKVFVGGVSHSVDEDAFKRYFSGYGEVSEAWLMYDPQTQRPRGFGFIVFAHQDGLNNCLANQNHEIAGKMVEVKRATPRSANPPPSRGPGGRGGPGNRGGRGGGGYGVGGYGSGGGYGGGSGFGMMPTMMGGYGCGYNNMMGSMGMPFNAMNSGAMGGGAMGGMGAMGAMGGVGGGVGGMGGVGGVGGAGGMGGVGATGGYGSGGYGGSFCCGACGNGCDTSVGCGMAGTGVMGGAYAGAYGGAGSVGAGGYGPARTGASAGREQRSYNPY